jgi:hypothetical protein
VEISKYSLVPSITETGEFGQHSVVIEEVTGEILSDLKRELLW